MAQIGAIKKFNGTWHILKWVKVQKYKLGRGYYWTKEAMWRQYKDGKTPPPKGGEEAAAPAKVYDETPRERPEESEHSAPPDQQREGRPGGFSQLRERRQAIMQRAETRRGEQTSTPTSAELLPVVQAELLGIAPLEGWDSGTTQLILGAAESMIDQHPKAAAWLRALADELPPGKVGRMAVRLHELAANLEVK